MAQPVSVRNMPDHIRAQYSIPQHSYQTSHHNARQHSQECEKDPKMLKFPNTKNVLWNHANTGPDVYLNISYYRKPKLTVSEKVLRLLQRHSENSKQSTCACSLIGSFQIEDDGEGVVLQLDRFSPYSVTSQQTGNTLMSGDVLLPFQISRNTNKERKSSVEEMENALKTLKETCCSKDAVNLSSFVKPCGWCSLYSNADKTVHHLEFDLVTMATVFKATPIMPVPIVPTALSKNLSGPMSISQVQGEPKTGYLTMDHTRKLLLVLDSDPKVSNLPLVGIWVSGVPFAYSPFVWATCLRYLHNSSLNDRVCVPPEPFLLVMYNPLHSKPEFYECVTSTSIHTMLFDLYSAYDVISLSKANASRYDIIEMNLDSVQNGPKKEIFDLAMLNMQTGKSLNTKNKESRNSPIEEFMPRCKPAPSQTSVPIIKSMVPEVTLFFDDDGLDTDVPDKQEHFRPVPQRELKPHNSNSHNQQIWHIQQSSGNSVNGQLEGRTDRCVRNAKTRNLKVSHHQVHFQSSIDDSAYPNSNSIQSSVGIRGQINPIQISGTTFINQNQQYLSQNMLPQQPGGPNTMIQPNAAQFAHLPHPSAFRQPVMNGIPYGSVSSAMVNQQCLPVYQPSQLAPVRMSTGQFCTQPQLATHSRMPNQPQLTTLTQMQNKQFPSQPQWTTEAFPNNHQMSTQQFLSQSQMPSHENAAFVQPTAQQFKPNDCAQSVDEFSHSKPNVQVVIKHGANISNSQENYDRFQTKQITDIGFMNSEIRTGLESHISHLGQVVPSHNTENQRTRQNNNPADQSGRSSDDSGLSITPEKLVLSPKTDRSRPPTMSNNLVKNMDIPNLLSEKYNWEQMPPEIYQLLMQQDTQLKQLQSQIEQLLQNQSNMVSSANVQTSTYEKETDKSIDINTTIHCPDEIDGNAPGKQSVSQQTSPQKPCRAASVASQCGTDSSQSTNPSLNSEGESGTPAEIRHKGRIQLNSTERDFDVDVSQGDLVSVMNDVHLSDKTVDSIQSDMIVDLPSYQSSPSRSYVSKGTGSNEMSSSSRSPVSASMCEQQMRDNSGSDGDAESEEDCVQAHSSPCNPSYYEKLMNNIQYLLHQSNEEGDSYVPNGNQSLDPPDSAILDEDTTLGKYLSTPLKKSEPDVNSTFFPKMDYVSMIVDDDSDMSFEINAMAMKYLKDEQLTQMTKLRTSAALRGNKDKQRNVLLRQILMSDKETTPNVTAYGMSPNDMTFNTKKYLEKHGLLDDTNSEKEYERDSSKDESYKLRLNYSFVSGESDGSAQVTHEVIKNLPQSDSQHNKAEKHVKQRNRKNLYGHPDEHFEYNQRISSDFSKDSDELSPPVQDIVKSQPFSPAINGRQHKKARTPQSISSQGEENENHLPNSPLTVDHYASPFFRQSPQQFNKVMNGHQKCEDNNILDITRLRQLPKLL